MASEFPEGAFFLPAAFQRRLEIPFKVGLTPEQVNEINGGNVMLYGKITYKDFRGRGKQEYGFVGYYDAKAGKFKQYDADSQSA